MAEALDKTQLGPGSSKPLFVRRRLIGETIYKALKPLRIQAANEFAKLPLSATVQEPVDHVPNPYAFASHASPPNSDWIRM
jgi:hypothetical protein